MLGKTCFDCKKNIGWKDNHDDYKTIKNNLTTNGINGDLVFDRMTNKDVLCIECSIKFFKRHPVEVYQTALIHNTPQQIEKQLKDNPHLVELFDMAKIQLNSQKSTSSPTQETTVSNTSTQTLTQTFIEPISKNTTAEELRQMTKTLHDQYKKEWDKNGVVQFKNEYLVILQRMWGQQVQFIIACAQISKEGYRLMAIDEGKTGGDGGFTGGVNAYFYFQKMDFVR